MKIKLKSIFLISAVISTLSTGVYAEDKIIYLNDGYISFAGNAYKNDSITICITEEGYDLMDETKLENANSEEFVYLSDTTSDANGEYAFTFKLKDNGIYNLYIGSNKAKEIEIYKIEYTNKEENDEAIRLLNEYVKNGTSSEVTNLLVDGGDRFRIYLGIYEATDLEKVGSLVYDYLKKIGEVNDSDEVKKIIEKALLIECLNSDKIDNIDKFKENLGLDASGLLYYSKGNSLQIQKLLQQTEILSIEDFDERLVRAIIVSGINNSDGTGVIRELLTHYYDVLGISKNNITSGLCSEIANNVEFNSLEAIKQFIKVTSKNS